MSGAGKRWTMHRFHEYAIIQEGPRVVAQRVDLRDAERIVQAVNSLSAATNAGGRQECLSVCSAHRERVPECPRCNVAMNAVADDAVAEVERLREIVKEAWRFWAEVNRSAFEQTLDRGYTILRVRSDRYAAFDALFRASAALASVEQEGDRGE